MDKEKIEKRITYLRNRYDELFKYVVEDNFTNSAGTQFFGEMSSITNELNILSIIHQNLK